MEQKLFQKINNFCEILALELCLFLAIFVWLDSKFEFSRCAGGILIGLTRVSRDTPDLGDKVSKVSKLFMIYFLEFRLFYFR